MQSRALSARGGRGRSRIAAAAAVITAFFLDTFTGAAGLLSAHTSDSGHTWGAAPTGYGGGASVLPNCALDGSGNLITTSSEGGAKVVGLTLPDAHSTKVIVNIPAHSNMWWDTYLNAVDNMSYRIYTDIYFSDSDTLEISMMVVGNDVMRANNLASPWHVDANFGVDMEFRWEVTVTTVTLFVDNVQIGQLTYPGGSVSLDGGLIFDGSIGTNVLIRSIEVALPA